MISIPYKTSSTPVSTSVILVLMKDLLSCMIRLFMILIVTTPMACSNKAFITVRNIRIDGVVFNNLTNQQMRNMHIYVKETNAFADCSYMPAKGQCSTTFPVRHYKGNSLSVTWVQNEKFWSKENFYAAAPMSLDWGAPAKIFINIKENGTVNAVLSNN